MANFKDAPGITKIALLVSSVGLLLQIIGFATTSWYTDGYAHRVGLWTQCWVNYCNNYFHKSDSFKAVEAMETIGLILAILSVGAFWYWSWVEDVPRRSSLNTVIVAGLGAAALSIFIGDIIFGINVIPYKHRGASSFILSIVGGVGLAVGAILEAVQLNSNTREQDSERQPLRDSDSSQTQKQDPDCRQDGFYQPANVAFSASAGYPESRTEFIQPPRYYTVENSGNL